MPIKELPWARLRFLLIVTAGEDSLVSTCKRTDMTLPGDWSQHEARAILALIVAAVLLLPLVPIRPPPVTGEGSDAVWLWHPALEDMRHGTGYYDAVERHMRDHSYALRPFYVWYLPGLMVFLHTLSDRAGQNVLLALYGVTAFVWAMRIRHVAALMVLLALIPLCSLSTRDSLWPLYDFWVGPLIALSLGLRPYNRPVSIAVGLLPLFIRMHAGLFAIVMLAFALHENRKKEAFVWLAGLVLFGVQIALHAWAVTARVTEADTLRRAVQPGLGFVITTMRCAPYFLWTAKDTLNGPTFALVIVGLWASRDARLLAIVISYFAAFFFIGHPINWYWGFMYAPLLAVALAYALPALSRLVRLSLPTTELMPVYQRLRRAWRPRRGNPNAGQ